MTTSKRIVSKRPTERIETAQGRVEKRVNGQVVRRVRVVSQATIHHRA